MFQGSGLALHLRHSLRLGNPHQHRRRNQLIESARRYRDAVSRPLRKGVSLELAGHEHRPHPVAHGARSHLLGREGENRMLYTST